MSDSAFQKIRKWFYNNSETQQRQYIKFTRKWSARSAFFQENRDDILRQATEVSGISAGRPGYLGALQTEITSQWKKLSLDAREEFQALADEWSSGIAPEAVKRRQVMQSSMRSLHLSSHIQDGILHAEAHHPGLPDSTIQDLWSPQSGPDFICR